jgi:hypothetical protein
VLKHCVRVSDNVYYCNTAANLPADVAERSDARGSTICRVLSGSCCTMCCFVYAAYDKETRERSFCMLLKVSLNCKYFINLLKLSGNFT